MPREDRVSRRSVLTRLGLTLAALPLVSAAASCSSGSSRRDADLPEPYWPQTPRTQGVTSSRTTTPKTEYVAPAPTSSEVIPRSAWAKAAPVPRLMDPAQRIYRITLHHDGMPSAFTSMDKASVAAHLEQIRQGHRDRNFGDIGYHFLVDPAGRIWAGRPLQWQGAHVKEQNEGNLGICIMGNYEIQQPNNTQLVATERFVAQAMRHYGVRVNNVRTHREMAPTACPGRYLQPQLVAMRRQSSLASA